MKQKSKRNKDTLSIQTRLQATVDELSQQNEEIYKIAAELMIANKELTYQNQEKEERAAELIIANKKIIAERKKREEKVLESEKLYHILFTNMPHGFAYCKATHANGKLIDYTYLSVNSKYEALTGLNSITGKNMLEVMPNLLESYPAYAEMIDGVALHNKSEKFEMHVSPLDKWLSISIYSPVKGYFVTLVDDITEIKHTEEKLTKLKELFSEIFQACPTGIFITRTADERIIDANESFLHLFDISREEAIGHTLTDLNMFSPGEQTKLAQEQTVTGHLNNFELLLKTKSGKSINLLLSSKQHEINGEQCYITTLVDITDRKIAQLNISKSEKLYRNLFKNILEGFAYCKAIINGEGRVIDFEYITVNKEFEKIFGLHNPIGKKATEALPGFLESDASYLEIINSVVLEKKTIQFETYLKTLNIWLSCSFYYSEDEFFVTVIEDITNRKNAEEEIIKYNGELRDLHEHLQIVREEERKRIGREIHDELGQQLTAIKMDLAWIEKQIQDKTPDIENKLKNITTLLDSSNESIRKILQDLRHGILEDNGLLKALEWQSNQFTEVTGIPVKFIAEETSLRLPEQMANSIFRLYQESLTNIARYAQASKVVISIRVDDKSIKLIVDDNGKGFDISSVQKSKSFGILGMKERVQSLNGKFELVSAKGSGTKIEITLPLKNI